MKKSISYKLIGLALIIVGIVACDTASQDVSPVATPDSYTKATFTTDFAGSTVNEGDTIVYHVLIDKMLDRALTFSARVVEGTGNEDDITVISGVLKPYTDTTTVKIIFNRDWSFEPTETMKIEIGVFSIATRYLVNKTTVNPILNLSVNNFVSDTLQISFDWSRDVDVYQIVNVKVNTGTYNVILRDTVDVVDNAANIDFDMIISEAAGFDISDPWSSNIVDASWTSNCPEVVKVIDYPDGEYIVWSDLYANNIQYLTAPKVFYGYKDSTQLALGVTQFIRQGTELDWNMVPDSTQAPFIYSQGYDDDGTIFNGILGKFIVADGKYTVVDYAGTESGPWKSSASRKPRPAEFIKNKR